MKDYSERRTVNTTTSNINRPKKQGVARYFVLTAVAGILAGYGLGLTSGWFMFRPTRQELNALRADAEKAVAQKTPPTPAAAPAPAQPVPTTGPVDPNLSFYKTLPSGKGILGTGLNPAKPEDPVQVPTSPTNRPVASPAQMAHPQQPVARPSQLPPQPLSPQERREMVPAEKSVAKPSPLMATPAPAPLITSPEQVRKTQPKGKYVVQVASYQSKSDAEAVKDKLIEAGLPAYIVEWVIKDKGIMYRVRVGRHLDLSAAEELALRAGKNSIPVME